MYVYTCSFAPTSAERSFPLLCTILMTLCQDHDRRCSSLLEISVPTGVQTRTDICWLDQHWHRWNTRTEEEKEKTNISEAGFGNREWLSPSLNERTGCITTTLVSLHHSPRIAPGMETARDPVDAMVVGTHGAEEQHRLVVAILVGRRWAALRDLDLRPR